MARLTLLALLLAGCTGPSVSGGRTPAPDPDDPPVVDTDPPIDCTLALSPASPWVTPHQEVRFEASGGGGDYSFALHINRSGALLDARSGAYLAGAVQDVQDEVEVSDAACPGVRAFAKVVVVPPLVVEPTNAVVRPGTVIHPSLIGGSGELACALEGADTGSTVDSDCVYRAGDVVGSERLVVTDLRTGQEVRASLRIDPAAAVTSSAPHWGGVVGEDVVPDLDGGSGHYALTVRSGPARVSEEGALRADVPGRSVVRVSDLYAGLELDLTYDALDVVIPDHLTAHGDRTDRARVLVHDFDGDGYDDVLLGMYEASVDHLASGAIWIFAGSPAGLEPEPAFVLSGGSRAARLGKDATLGDVDGDGVLDLITGEFTDDTVRNDQGRVLVFAGVEGGFFAEEPLSSVSFGSSGDQLGAAVASCDLDGDGYDDVLVSAPLGEDPDGGAALSSQGVVYGLRGGPDGLAESPDQVFAGHRAGLQLGRDIVTGDVDGDGRCDVVASAYDSATNAVDAGSAYLWLGASGVGSAVPDATIDHDDASDPDGRLGRRMAMGDLDGDRQDELVLAGDAVDQGGPARGALAIFTPDTLLGGSELTLDDADWIASADNNYDRLGWEVQLLDVDGDGRLDLLANGYQDEGPGGPNSTGAVRVWHGVDLQADLRAGRSGGPSTGVVAGSVASERMGVALGVGDLDGDGDPDLVALAGRDSTDGPWTGALHVWDSLSASSDRIGLPRVAHGSLLGLGMAWTRGPRGSARLTVGAPSAPSDFPRARGGVVWSFDPEDPETIDHVPDLPREVDNDRLGWSLGGGGDFDGDGVEDLIVVSREADRPGSFSSAEFANPTACAGAQTNNGAALVVTPGRSRARAILYGLAGDMIERAVDGDIDVNGDGLSDLVVTTRVDVGRQGVWVAFGRALDPDRTTVLCDARLLTSRERGSNAGVSVTALGDLDGDGCDELAIGANSDDRVRNNQGSVRIIRGWGGRGCPADPAVTDLVPDFGGVNFGTELAAGDFTGDGIRELIVSATNQPGDDGERGVVYLLDGAAIGRLAAIPVPGEQLPSGTLHAVNTPALTLDTVRAGALDAVLGRGLAVSGSGTSTRLWVASRNGARGGGTGHVRAFRWDGAGLVPDTILVGPPTERSTEFGTRIATRPDGEEIAVSAYTADGIGSEVGEVFFWSGE